MPDRPPILIAGGGIGGLATALALAKTGRRVEIFERSSSLDTAGAGIQLGPNAVKVLRQLGVADVIQPHVSTPDALVMHTGSRGTRLARMPLGDTIAQRHSAPYWTIHRADLHRALAEAVRRTDAITLTANREVVSALTSATGGVAVASGDGTTVTAAALIGADGLWSRVRSIIAPGVEPVPSGYCAYRALIPVTLAGSLDPRIVGAWLSPDVHVIHYPVHAGRALNIVVIVHEPWTSTDWSAPADAATVIGLTQSFSSGLRQAIASAPQWHKWSLAEPIVLPAWHRGPVALLGDAAHAMLPFFAQGGAMALEDAVAVAASIAHHGGDFPAAFAAYITARQQRTARVQVASANNGRVFHLSGPAALSRNVVMRLMPPSTVLARFDWLYGYGGPVI